MSAWKRLTDCRRDCRKTFADLVPGTLRAAAEHVSACVFIRAAWTGSDKGMLQKTLLPVYSGRSVFCNSFFVEIYGNLVDKTEELIYYCIK